MTSQDQVATGITGRKPLLAELHFGVGSSLWAQRSLLLLPPGAAETSSDTLLS